MITNPRPEDSSSPIYKKPHSPAPKDEMYCARCQWRGLRGQLLDGDTCPSCKLVGECWTQPTESKRPGEEVATPKCGDACISPEMCEALGHCTHLLPCPSCATPIPAWKARAAAPLDEECMGHLREMYEEVLSMAEDSYMYGIGERLMRHLRPIAARLGFKPDREGG